MWRSKWILLALLVCSCGGTTEGPTIANDASLVVTIVSSSPRLVSGEPVTLTVAVENRSDSLVTFGSGSSSCQLVSFVVVDDRMALIPVDRVCTTDAAPYRLAAGQRRSESWQWTGEALIGNERKMLAPGTYAVYGGAGEFRSPQLLIEIE